MKQAKKESEKEALAGDKVLIEMPHEKIEGTLLESYDKDIVLVKLDSGYNQGIKKQDVQEIKVTAKKAAAQEKESEFAQDTKLPKIGIIVTGGTISSKLDPSTGGVKWLSTPEQLFSLVPEISKIARIETIEVPFMLASENMTAKEWQIIAKKTVELLNRPDLKGVIITHGTDTLHYTAAALSFMIKNVNKPVALTYAQRSSDRGSSDTKMNLVCAAHAALSDIAEVMLIGHGTLDDEYCIAVRGTKARKMHSSRRDTFRPINELPLANIYPDGRIETMSYHQRRNENEKADADLKFEEHVALLKYYPGAKPDLLEFLIEKGCKGVVVEATGLGHVATEESRLNWLPAIKKAVRAGMTVCFAVQTIYGRLDPYVYSPGRTLLDAGVLFLEDMLPETAYVKLGWVLAHASEKEKIKELMLRNLAGEMNKHLTAESFLY